MIVCIHTHKLTQTQLTNMHIFGMWEKTAVPGENPPGQWPQPELIIFSHQHHNEMLLNKMILLEDLLSILYFATLTVSFPLSFYLSFLL